jgi:hypothetical protein
MLHSIHVQYPIIHNCQLSIYLEHWEVKIELKMNKWIIVLQLNAETTKVLTILISWGVPFKLVILILVLKWAFLIGHHKKILKIWKPPYIELFIPNIEKYVPMLVHLYNFQEDIN